MSTRVTIELPDDAFSALRSSPNDFVNEMRFAAAAKWYEIGLVSQAKASITGRVAFPSSVPFVSPGSIHIFI